MKIKRWFLINIDKVSGEPVNIIATFPKELDPKELIEFEKPTSMFYWKVVEVEYDVDTNMCY